MEIYDVVTKLVGPVKPIGETNTDERRLITEPKQLVKKEMKSPRQPSRGHAGRGPRYFTRNVRRTNPISGITFLTGVNTVPSGILFQSTPGVNCPPGTREGAALSDPHLCC